MADLEGDEVVVRSEGVRFAGWLAAITAVGLVARIGYVLTVGSHLTLGLDATWYELQAGTLAHGKGYIDPDSFYRLGRAVPTANFPPLWPVVLAVANRLGLDTRAGYQLVGAVLGSATVGLTGLLGRRVAGPVVGLAAALLVALCPMLIAADGSLMSESLYVLAIVLVLLAAYRALDRPTPARFAVVGLLLGLAALTRVDALFLAPILVGTLAWRVRGPSTSQRVVLGGCLLGVTVVVLAPWVAYSSSRMGGVVLVSSNSGNEVEGANCPSTFHGPLLGGWDAACIRPTPPGVSELSWATTSRQVGLDYATSHPARLPVVAAARVLRVWGLWSPVSQAHLEDIESRNFHWQLLGWGYDLAMLALAVPGTVLLIRRRAELAPLVAVVGAVIVTAALSNGNQRFRLAADPILAVAAATFLIAAWPVTRPRRSRPSDHPTSTDLTT